MSLALAKFAIGLNLYLGAVFCVDIRNTYRPDYKRCLTTDNFYKIHLETRDHVTAQRLCEMEGADLATLTDDDVFYVKSIRSNYEDVDSDMWIKEDRTSGATTTEVYVRYKESAEEDTEPPVYDPYREMIENQCSVMTKKGDLQTSRCAYSLPFICKVNLNDIVYDSVCDVYGTGYIRGRVGSCYKILPQRLTWNEASWECEAERAHLLVLNSEDEQSFIVNMLYSRTENPNPYIRYFIGGRALATKSGTPKEMKTIFNETLEDAGFSTWTSYVVPVIDNERDTCLGLMETDGSYVGLDCEDPHVAICEKEIIVAAEPLTDIVTDMP